MDDNAENIIEDGAALHPAFHWNDEIPRVIESFDGKLLLSSSFPLSKCGSLENAKRLVAISKRSNTAKCLICSEEFTMRILR
jgi:hypothetical protein